MKKDFGKFILYFVLVFLILLFINAILYGIIATAGFNSYSIVTEKIVRWAIIFIYSPLLLLPNKFVEKAGTIMTLFLVNSFHALWMAAVVGYLERTIFGKGSRDHDRS